MQVAELDTTVRDYINEIEQRHQQLETRNKELESAVIELKNYQYKYFEVKEQLDLLLHKRFGRSAEQLLEDKSQPLLFEPEAVPSESDVQAKQEETLKIKSYSRKKGGRKPLSDNLTRDERVIDIPESEKTCACGAKLTRIGEEVSEKLQIIAPRIFVEKIVRPKYACRQCEGTEDEEKAVVRIAPVEPSIIPKSIVSPSLLSTIVTQKFEMHLPYYRQEKQFEYIGVTISRQDMSNWQQKAYQNLAPLFGFLKESLKSGPVIQMDETTVQVMGEEDRKDTQKSYMWLARGGLPGKKVLWYEYHETRASHNAKKFLEGYKGYLQTDGYEGYDCAVKDMPGIIHVGCFAHARRKFFEAAKVAKDGRTAQEGIKYIRNLYDIEDDLRSQGLDDIKFLSERKAQAEPALEKFKTWLMKRQEDIPPTLLLGKAIHYSLAQWDKMAAYLGSQQLTPDNNACENAIRPFVLGRKNWLFCKSPQGAESSCGMYTLIETAKQNGLIPFNYLIALLERAPLAVLPEDWKKLLPWNIFTA
ncbi:MAG: IS66 family transposase [Treponema sp.]|jgi:transposase|nr:IS66 family transposase [Treponema sp.]